MVASLNLKVQRRLPLLDQSVRFFNRFCTPQLFLCLRLKAGPNRRLRQKVWSRPSCTSMGKPKGGAKGPKGVKGGSRGKGKTNAQHVYTAQERSQAYLVNAERVAAGLAPASIASICRSRRRSPAQRAELHLAEVARRSEPTVPRPAPPAPPAPRRRVPFQEDRGEAEEGGAAPLKEAPPPSPESPVQDGGKGG